MKQGSQILRALGQKGQNYLTEQFITYVNPISSFKIDDPLTSLRSVVSREWAYLNTFSGVINYWVKKKSVICSQGIQN